LVFSHKNEGSSASSAPYTFMEYTGT
jgi:hypothetical protein